MEPILKHDTRSLGKKVLCTEDKTTTGYGESAFRGEVFASVQIIVFATGVTTGATIDFMSSPDFNEPDWNSANAKDNLIYNGEAINQASSSVGILNYDITADGTYMFEYNTNGSPWFNVNFSAVTDGTYTVWYRGYNL